MSGQTLPTAARQSSPSTPVSSKLTHRPFTLLLSGGGARGFAHAGVESRGYRPSAIVGVSMGAIVGGSYTLHPDWYRALLDMDTRAFPKPMPTAEQQRSSFRHRLQGWWRSLNFGYRMVTGWGIGVPARAAGLHALRALTLGKTLDAASPPLAVSATDLNAGRRHIFRSGDATEAIYASSALAGVLPPLEIEGSLLADGAYSDLAPSEGSSPGRHGINGYGVIGKRVADAVVAQSDMTLAGVADIVADWRVAGVHRTGYPLYAATGSR